MVKKIHENFEEKYQMKMRFLIIISFLNIFLFADDGIKDIVEQEYRNQNLSYYFDQYTNEVIEKYKIPRTPYNAGLWGKTKYFFKQQFEALEANYGVNTKDVANNMMNDIFSLYGNDLSNFVNTIITDDILIKKIKQNYDEYITESSSLVYDRLDKGFRDKFLNLYNANSLDVLLTNDIKDKILVSKENIMSNVRHNVEGNQPTTLMVAGGMIIGGVIMESVSKQIQKKTIQAVIQRIIGKGTLKLGSKLIPLVGEVLAVYELGTLNEIYEVIGDEIKKEFHKNEMIIIDNISGTLSDIDNISVKYQISIENITEDYISKAKVPYTYLHDKASLKEKLLQSDNYVFLEIIENFYRVPAELYVYVIKKYFNLKVDQKHKFVQYIAKMDDIYAIENVMLVEKKLGLKIPFNEFDKAIEFYDSFEDLNDIIKFYTFLPKLDTYIVNISNLESYYYDYELLKNNKYLMERYVQLKESDRERLLSVAEEGKVRFDNIAYYEKKYENEVPSEQFVAMAELLNKFSDEDEIDKFYAFVTKAIYSDSYTYPQLNTLYAPYRILSESEYLQNKYSGLGETDRKKLLKLAKENISLFDNIQKFEISHQNIKISKIDFIKMALLLSKFKNTETIGKFYNFVKLVKQGTVIPNDMHMLNEPYQVLKDNEYLMEKYASLEKEDRIRLLDVGKEQKMDFGKIAYFESKYNIDIPSNEFVAMAKLFSKFLSTQKINISITKYKDNFGKIDLKNLKIYLQSNTATKYIMIMKEVIIKNIAFFYLLISVFLLATIYFMYRKKYVKNNTVEVRLLSHNSMVSKEKIDIIPYKDEDNKC
jgi:acyl carrier protein